MTGVRVHRTRRGRPVRHWHCCRQNYAPPRAKTVNAGKGIGEDRRGEGVIRDQVGEIEVEWRRSFGTVNVGFVGRVRIVVYGEQRGRYGEEKKFDVAASAFHSNFQAGSRKMDIPSNDTHGSLHVERGDPGYGQPHALQDERRRSRTHFSGEGLAAVGVLTLQ